MIYNDPALWPRQQKTVTVTITGAGESTYSSVTINGVKYTSAAVVQIDRGTKITCSAGGAMYSTGSISLDGETVASKTGGTVTYTHIADKDCTINLSYTNYSTYVRSGSVSIKTT